MHTIVPSNPTPGGEERLLRGLGLKEATALNMIDMVGIGPFITTLLILGAMGGRQAMLGWLFGALLAIGLWIWLFLATASGFILRGLGVLALGIAVYLIRARMLGEFPFAAKEASAG